MNLFHDYSDAPIGSAILLSVKPKFADLIVEGSKLVELRRAIPKQSLSTVAIYASSPIQSIVALADVKEIIETSPLKLWKISEDNGGGLTKAELMTYFALKKTGFALMLENVRAFTKPVSPTKIFKPFTAPQSFKYLSSKELHKLEAMFEKKLTK